MFKSGNPISWALVQGNNEVVHGNETAYFDRDEFDENDDATLANERWRIARWLSRLN